MGKITSYLTCWGMHDFLLNTQKPHSLFRTVEVMSNGVCVMNWTMIDSTFLNALIYKNYVTQDHAMMRWRWGWHQVYNWKRHCN